jgi:hypothetical protein
MTQKEKIGNIGMDVDYTCYMKEYPNYTGKILLNRKCSGSENYMILSIILLILFILIINKFKQK